MKILHLITRLILGGAQENTLLTCEGLAQRGHEVILAYGPIYGPEGSLYNRAKQGGYQLIEIPNMLRPIRPLKDYACYRTCRKLIRQLQPDVVHTHSSKAGIIGRAAASAENVPTVIHTIHGLPFHPYQSKLINRIYISLERYAAKRAHKIVTVCDAMRDQALAENIGQPDQYETVYSGMEIEPFIRDTNDRQATRTEYNIKPDEIVIGTVARLSDLKGHDDLLEVLPELVQRFPNVKLMWVGDGWLREKLEQKLDQMRLKQHVVLVGMVNPDQIPRFIRAMDVLVHPSYREGLARALPQALLTRVPVVSYDCDGAPEVCREAQTGKLVPTGDIESLKNALTYMCEHPDARKAMGEAGRKYCRERFDHHVMVRELERIYEQCHAQTG